MEQKGMFTEFGLQVHMFCAQTRTSKKQLAASLGISYDTLLAACIGRRAGHEVKPLVLAYMNSSGDEQRRRCV